jgi:hypothetical protein
MELVGWPIKLAISNMEGTEGNEQGTEQALPMEMTKQKTPNTQTLWLQQLKVHSKDGN